MIFALCYLTIYGCGQNDIKYVWDYYNEYCFEPPFEVIESHYAGSVYFTTDYSMDQMCTFINEAGYTAELYCDSNVSTILISVRKDTFTYYFVIYDKNHTDKNDRYTLCDAQLIYGSPGNTGLYLVLAPIHIIDKTNDGKGLMRVYGSFDYISDFYRSTGKNDFDIDIVNQTITFNCQGNPKSGIFQGDVVIRYTETDDGNFLEIEPMIGNK